MVSNFEIDVNCSYCFDDLVAALRDVPTVSAVHGSMTGGCLSIAHDTDEQRLSDIIVRVGHRMIITGNGEIMQDELHPSAGHVCRIHR